MHHPKRFAIAAAVLLVSAAGATCAEDRASAGIVTTLTGEASVIRATLPQPASLHRRDDVFMRDEIRTEPRSFVRVLLGGKALITVRELSVLRVTEEAGHVTVDLASGKIGVAVVKARMRPGESLEVRSPNAIAAVRGTVFVVEVNPGQAAPAGTTPGAPTTRIDLLHGALDVSARYDAAQAVRLAELQSVVVSGNTVGSVQPLSQDAVAALTADLKPHGAPSPEAPLEFTGGLVAREQIRAVGVAASLLGVAAPTAQVTSKTAAVLQQLMDGLGLGDQSGSDKLVGRLGETVGNTAGSLDLAVGAAGNVVGTTSGGLGATAGGAVSGLGGSLGGTVSGVGGPVAGLGGSAGGTVGGLGGTTASVGAVGGGTVGGAGGGVLGGLLSGGLLRK